MPQVLQCFDDETEGWLTGLWENGQRQTSLPPERTFRSVTRCLSQRNIRGLVNNYSIREYISVIQLA